MSDFEELQKVHNETKLILQQEISAEKEKQKMLVEEISREKSIAFKLSEELKFARETIKELSLQQGM